MGQESMKHDKKVWNGTRVLSKKICKGRKKNKCE